MVLKKKRVSSLNVLLILDAFVLGGCVALLIVNRLSNDIWPCIVTDTDRLL